MEFQSDNNLTIFLTSNANLDMYPNNDASKFTNVLKQSIRLNPNVDYQARLANFHIPNVEYVFKEYDFEGSSLKYHISLFEYDPSTRGYLEHEKYRRELFRLAPDKNIEGLFEAGDLKSKFNPADPENNDQMDVLGKPYARVKKAKFLYNLSHSLVISTEDNDKYQKQSSILSWIRHYLNKNKSYHFGEYDNLFVNQFLDLNYVQMTDFGHLNTKSRGRLFYKLLKAADYSEQTREFLHNVGMGTGTLSPPETTSAALAGRNESENSEDVPRTERSVADSLLEIFTPEEIRLLYKNPALRNPPFETDDTVRDKRDTSSLLDLALRWKKFGRDYKKMYVTGGDSRDKAEGSEMLVGNDQATPVDDEDHDVHGDLEEASDEEDEQGRPLDTPLIGGGNTVPGEEEEGEPRPVAPGLIAGRTEDVAPGTEMVDGVKEGEITFIGNFPNGVESLMREYSLALPLSDQPSGPPPKKKKKKRKKTPSSSLSAYPRAESLTAKTTFLGFYVTLGKHMAKFFGIDEDEKLLLAGHGEDHVDIAMYNHKLSPDFLKPQISTLMVYSDIILPKIHVGNSLTNILDIISVPHGKTFQRSNTVGLYRPLKDHTIQSISIAIYDRDGDEIYFPKNSFSALELEIRPFTLDM